MFALDAQRLAGEELEDLPGANDFANRFRQGLAFLAGQQGTQLLAPQENLRTDEVKRVGPLLRGLGGPQGLCLFSGSNRGLGIFGGCLGIQADQIVGIRWAEVFPNANAVQPLPCN
ncbi:hypothetical protein D3C84_938950 [compost metagenome]